MLQAPSKRRTSDGAPCHVFALPPYAASHHGALEPLDCSGLDLLDSVLPHSCAPFTGLDWASLSASAQPSHGAAFLDSPLTAPSCPAPSWAAPQLSPSYACLSSTAFDLYAPSGHGSAQLSSAALPRCDISVFQDV